MTEGNKTKISDVLSSLGMNMERLLDNAYMEYHIYELVKDLKDGIWEIKHAIDEISTVSSPKKKDKAKYLPPGSRAWVLDFMHFISDGGGVTPLSSGAYNMPRGEEVVVVEAKLAVSLFRAMAKVHKTASIKQLKTLDPVLRKYADVIKTIERNMEDASTK